MAGRRPNGAGSIRKLRDGLYEGRYTDGTRADGKPKRKSVFGKTQREVSNKLQEIQTKIRNGTFVEPSKTTLEQWLEEWLEHTVRITNKQNTYDNYSMLMYKHVVPRIGHIQLGKLRPGYIQNLMSELIDDGRVQVKKGASKGLSNTTVRTIRKVLRYALQKAVQEDVLAVNPVDATKAPPIKKSEPNVLEPTEFDQLIASIRGDRYELIYLLAIKLGLRRGELLGLRWRDIDFEKCHISVKQQLVKTGEGCRFETPKSNRSYRKVHLDQDLINRLRRHKAKQGKQRLLANDLWEDNDLVFCTGVGKPIHPNTISQAFRRLRNQRGMRKIRFHDLRHTFATYWLAAKGNIKTLQYMLGHSKASFTLDTYTHVTKEILLDDAHKMESYLERIQYSHRGANNISEPF